LLQVILQETGRRFLKGLPFTLALMASIGAGMYFYNLYAIGWLNNGWRFDKPMRWLGFYSGTTNATGGINPFGFLFGGTGAAFTVGALWFIVPTLLMQFLRKGPAGTLEDWGKAPLTVQRYFAQSGPAARAELCVGAGTGLVIGACAFGYSSLALAAGLGVFLGTQGSRVVSLLVSSMWSATQAKLRGPPGGTRPSEASGFIAMVGGIGGLLIRQIFPTWFAFLAGAVLLGVALSSTQGGVARARPLLIFMIATAALVFSPSLFGDDGGFVEWAVETGKPQTFAGFLEWLRQTGQAANVRDLALLHALYQAAVGGAIGGWWRALAQLPPELANQFQPPTRAQEQKQSPPLTAKQEPRTDSKPEPRAPERPKQPRTDPSLVDPSTGEPLVVNDGGQAGGKPGQVKFGDRWMDRDEASELIADNLRAIKNREEQQRQFLDESRRSSDAWMEKHARPEPDPAPTEPDVAQTLNRLRDLGDKTLADVTDPAQRDFMRNFLDRHSDDPDAMRRAILAVQTHNSANADDQLVQAAWWNGATETAADARDWAMTINRGFARLVPGGGSVVRVQALLTGAVEGYEQGGLTGAAGKTLATLADNALSHELGVPTGGIISTIYNNGGDLGKSAQAWSNQYNPADYLHRLNEVRTNWPDNPMDGIRSVLDTGLDAADARDDLRQLRDAYIERTSASSDESALSSPPKKRSPETPRETPSAETNSAPPASSSHEDATPPPATSESDRAGSPPERIPETRAAKTDATHSDSEGTRSSDRGPTLEDEATKTTSDPPPIRDEAASPEKDTPAPKEEPAKPPVDEREAGLERKREEQRLQMEDQKRRQEEQQGIQTEAQDQQQAQAKHGNDAPPPVLPPPKSEFSVADPVTDADGRTHKSTSMILQGDPKEFPNLRDPGEQKRMQAEAKQELIRIFGEDAADRQLNAAHLGANQFGGPGGHENLIMVPETANLSGHGSIESKISDHLKSGAVVDVKVTASTHPGTLHLAENMTYKGEARYPDGQVVTINDSFHFPLSHYDPSAQSRETTLVQGQVVGISGHSAARVGPTPPGKPLLDGALGGPSRPVVPTSDSGDNPSAPRKIPS